MTPFFGTIKERLVFLVVVMVLLTAGLIVASVANLSVRSAEEMKKTHDRLRERTLLVEWEEKAKALTALLAAQSVHPVSAIDHFTLNVHARLILAEQDVRYAYVLDRSGRVLSDGTETMESVGSVLSDALTRNALAADGTLVHRQGDIVDVSHPVKLGSARLATVRAGFSMERINEAIHRINEEAGETMGRMNRETIFQTLMWTLLLSAFVLVIGYFIVGNAISSPLRELVVAAKRIGAGDLTHRVKVKATYNEIDELGVSFNEMVGRLQKQTRELEESEEQYRNLVETTPHGIQEIDVSGNILYCNPALCLIMGYSAEEFVGMNVADLLPDEKRDGVMSDIARFAREQPEPAPYFNMNFTKDGRVIDVEVNWNYKHDEEGSVIGFTSIIADITSRKEAEIALLEAKEHAEVASRAKSEFMSKMSHELRTPLNAVIGFSSTIQAETFGPLGHEKYYEYVNDIHDSGKHLLELINDILDVSAIEAGKLELHEENLDVGDVAEAAMRLVRQRAEDGEVHLRLEIDDGLPPLYADGRRVKQILLNLLFNALKFTPPGGRVTLSASLNDGGAHNFTVTDTGIGMDKKELAIALSEFGQVDSGFARKHEGTGLGLPLTRGLVWIHGGTLEIDSRKDKGTTVTVSFPPERASAEG